MCVAGLEGAFKGYLYIFIGLFANMCMLYILFHSYWSFLKMLSTFGTLNGKT